MYRGGSGTLGLAKYSTLGLTQKLGLIQKPVLLGETLLAILSFVL